MKSQKTIPQYFGIIFQDFKTYVTSMPHNVTQEELCVGLANIS